MNTYEMSKSSCLLSVLTSRQLLQRGDVSYVISNENAFVADACPIWHLFVSQTSNPCKCTRKDVKGPCER